MVDIWIEKLPKAKRGPHRGKVRYKVRYRTNEGGARKTSSEIFTAKSAAEKFKEDLIAGNRPREKLTMSELADDFVEIECSPLRKKAATAKDCKSIIRNHIKRHIGDILVDSLCVRDVQRMQDSILKIPINRKGLKKTKPPGPRAANKALIVTKMLLKFALAHEYIKRSPVLRMEPLKYDRREGIALSEFEVDRLLSAAEEPFKSIILIAVNTGMRSGELMGLDWADISFRRRTIDITRQFTQRELRDTLKTKKSKRTVPMNDSVFACLQAMRIRADLSNWVFPGIGDLPMCGEKVLRQGLRPALKRAGLDPEIRFHDLRYTAASRMAKNGVPAVAAGKVLGHNSLSMTEHYSKPDEEMTRAAVKDLWGPGATGDNISPITSSERAKKS